MIQSRLTSSVELNYSPSIQHLGILKAKLAKLRREALEGPKTGGNSAERSFEVVKYGDARVAVVGFPSTGKSTFLSTVTETESEAASCKFHVGWSSSCCNC